MQFRSSGVSDLPPVVKNLLIINGLVFLIKMLVQNSNSQYAEFYAYGALWPLDSGFFRVWQPITYMFMHGNWSHIIFNMLTLWMFGRILENYWGSKRFLQFYFICGVAAAGAHLLTSDASAVGASGAIMGLMAAFAYLFPNSELYLFFLPVPIKAKYVIPGLMALDIFGIIYRGPGDNVAHWAHLGGALAGLVIVMYWNKSKGNRRNFY